MRTDMRRTTVVAMVLICALALTIGVLPSIAANDGTGASQIGAIDLDSKFPDEPRSDLPRFRSPAEMSLVQIGSVDGIAPSVMIAADDVYEGGDPVLATPELEEFRAQVVAYVAELQDVAALLGETDVAKENPELFEPLGGEMQISLAEFDAAMAAVPAEDLARAKAIFETDPHWDERPAQLWEMITAQDSPGGDVQTLWGAWTPPTDYDGSIFAARYVAVNAAIAFEILDPSVTVVIFGAGASIPNPVRIAAVIAWGVAENAIITLEIGQDNRDDYNIEYLIDHAHKTGDRVSANLDISVSSVDGRLATHDTTVANRFTSVDSDLLALENHLLGQDLLLDALELHLQSQDASMAARFDFVDGELASVRTQLDAQDAYLAETRRIMIRTSIENDLLSSTPPLATYFIPASDGGLLDDARTVVVETIASMRAAGMSVNNADAELLRGDIAYSASDYKGAYERYRSAYQEAVR